MYLSKSLVVAACAVLVAGAMVESTFAQGRGRGRGFGGRGMGGNANASEVLLLNMKEVREHLQEKYDATKEDMEKVAKISESAQQEIREETRAIMSDFRQMSEEERTDARKELQEVTKEITDEATKKAKEVLSKDQWKRLGQLRIQRMGTNGLNDEIMQMVLGFSKEQSEKMKSLGEMLREKRQDMMSGMREKMEEFAGDREAMREWFTETMQKMQKESEKSTMEILTDEQKKKWEEMKGDAFEFPAPQRRGGRRPID